MPSQGKQVFSQCGQGMLEYSLIILFVALVVFGGLILLGPQVASVYNLVHQAL